MELRPETEVKAEADAIMKAPLGMDPYSQEGKVEINRRAEAYRLAWSGWNAQRDDLLKAERAAERAAHAKAEREAEKAEREAAKAEGRTVKTTKGGYRAPKGDQAPKPVQKIETNGSRNCKACGKPIPPTGKRGRPAVYHDVCRP